MTAPWPPPTGSPAGTSGWLFTDGRWVQARTAEPWRASTWGLGDAWWALLVYVVASVVLTVGLVTVTVATGNDLDEFELGSYGVGVLVVGNVLAFLGVPLLASRRKGLGNLAADFGLRVRPVDLAIGLGVGLGGMLLAGLAATLIDAALDAEESTTNIPVDAIDGVGEFVVFFAAVAVVTPVVEELFFRGLVYRSFAKRGASRVAATAWTTVLFVVPHLSAVSSPVAVVSLAASIGILGLAFQMACHATGGRLGAAIVAHAVVNGSAVIALTIG